MTIIKRNPDAPLPTQTTEDAGSQHSDGGRRGVLRQYVTEQRTRIAGKSAYTGIAQTDITEHPLDIALAKEQLQLLEQESKQQLQAELANMRDRSVAELQRELSESKRRFERELEQQKSQTISEAYSKGLAKGEQDGKAEYARAIQDVFKTISKISEEKQAFVANSQSEILALSLRIAKKIVLTEITQTPEALMGIVKDAIRRITDKDKVLIKLNGEEADHIRQHQDDILAQMPDIKSLEVHEDARIEAGGCVIETRLGYIDATLTTKLEILEKAFVKAAEDT